MASAHQTMSYLPGSGEWSFAEKRRFDPVIVFIPHFGGSRLTLRKHIDFVNHIGFDAVSINLEHNNFKKMPKIPLSSDLKFGLRHIWTEQIETVLNSIPRKKIIYSFSMPSVAALSAIQRRNASDIIGLICDGGPFIDILKSAWNLFTFAFPVKNPILRAAAVGGTHYLWGSQWLAEDTESAIKSLPQGFPVMSIRGWQDELVPPAMIDKVFAGHDQIQLEILSLPEGGHLNGLTKFPLEYKPRVIRFLEKLGERFTENEPVHVSVNTSPEK